MYKHEEIINKLTVEQKLALLSDINSLTDAELVQVGIPQVNSSSLLAVNSVNGKSFPCFENLANSWDEELFEKVALNLSEQAKKDGVNLMATPPVNALNNVFESGLSEDPYLSGKMVQACVNALNQAGVMPCISSFSVSKTSKDYFDLQVNKAALNEYVIKPFKIAIENSEKCAVQTSVTKLKGNYADVNSSLMQDVLIENKNVYGISEKADAELAVTSITSGNITSFNGSFSALKYAYNNYKKLKEEIENGSIYSDELEKARNEGTAISDEDVNNAVDKVIDFAFSCQNISSQNKEIPTYDAKSLAYEASIKSAVLLKNEKNLLPLNKNKKVAVIGQLANDNFLNVIKDYCAHFVGYEKGYDLLKERSDDLIEAAVQTASKADQIIVVLGLDTIAESKIVTSRSVKLPANQLALLDALIKTEKPIATIISSKYSIDMQFDDRCSAVMLAPINGEESSKAIADLLYGKANPSGRLAITRYDNTDEYFAKIRAYKNAEQIKIGQFIGYKNYETAKQKIKYPFGFGLSYSSFTYSNALIKNNQINFTVKNVGKQGGIETAQIYLGKPDSAVLRPAKTLVAFVKIPLKQGESKTVSIKIEDSWFKTYNLDSEQYECEAGEYFLYIGSNVNSANLVATIKKEGNTFESSDEKYSDYLLAVSNIVSNGYTLEKVKNDKVKNHSVKNKKSKVSALLLTLLICIDVLIAVLEVLSLNSGIRLISFNAAYGTFIPSVIITAVVNVALLIVIIIKIKNKSVKYMDKKQKSISEMTFEELFINEFTEVEEKEDEENKNILRDDFSEYFDKALTMPALSERLVKVAAGRGISIDKNTADKVLAAMYASRLVILKANAPEELPKFAKILSEFFGCEYRAESIDESYVNLDRLLYVKREDETYEATSVLKTINAASELEHYVQIATLNNVNAQTVNGYMAKFARYINNPIAAQKVSVSKQISANIYTTSPNLWFVLCLGEGQNTADIPASIAEAAAFVNLKIAAVPEEQEVKYSPVSYHQFVALGDQCRNKNDVNEDLWKKLDKLEAFVNARNATYKLGNRIWIQVEKYVAVCLDCGLDVLEALDAVLAGKVIPFALPLLKGKLSAEDGDFSHAVENIFGEDNVPLSTEYIKQSGLYEVKEDN